MAPPPPAAAATGRAWADSEGELAFNVGPDKDPCQACAVSGKEPELMERANAEDPDVHERGERRLERPARVVC